MTKSNKMIHKSFCYKKIHWDRNAAEIFYYLKMHSYCSINCLSFYLLTLELQCEKRAAEVFLI